MQSQWAARSQVKCKEHNPTIWEKRLGFSTPRGDTNGQGESHLADAQL